MGFAQLWICCSVLLVICPRIGVGQEMDSVRARRMLATLLNVDPSSMALHVSEAPISLYPGVRSYIGEAPGYHAAKRAWVARLPDSTLIPLGCRAGRLVLQAASQPVLSQDSIFVYAALLASLDGAVPPGARPILKLEDVPRRWREWADDHGVRLEMPAVRSLSGGIREVTVLVKTDALYRVVVVLGSSRWEDEIKSVRLIMGVPPG